MIIMHARSGEAFFNWRREEILLLSERPLPPSRDEIEIVEQMFSREKARDFSKRKKLIEN
jgi:hypothetical protein